ncbi:MAG TPA: Calx-beta domain-containing protein [Candidatus Limnocylindria bacterium]|jgi:hypothetical protein|nr:Calx-beta domain-containing protein [Candidatus Limnocylindria bacterium]
MIAARRARALHAFRPLALLVATAVAVPISLPSASLAATLPTLSINDVTITEGNAGTLTMSFTVTQTGRGKSSVRYATVDGSATSPADFVARTGTLKFAGGHRRNKVAITIVGDTLDEANERFFVRLSNPSGATISNAVGTGTITDDDAPPTVSTVGTLTVPEGNTGDSGYASVDVTLSAPSGRPVSVDFTTADGSATAGSDYGLTAGTLDFTVGHTTGSIVVPIFGDDAAEGDETFDVDISNPVNAALGTDSTSVTIQDNDPIPPGSAVLNVTGASVREGTGSTKTLTFTVTRSGETTTAVDVDYQTSNGSAHAVSDYTSASGNLSFGVGVTTATVQVQIKGDRRLEHRERFFLSLINPSAGAAIEHGQARGYIRDDDTWTRFTSFRKVNGHIRVKGRLSPAHPNKLMVVTLSRRKNGVWVFLRVRRPQLSGSTDLGTDGFSDSRFGTSFIRPRAGRCRIVARFPGDSAHRASSATKYLDC